MVEKRARLAAPPEGTRHAIRLPARSRDFQGFGPLRKPLSLIVDIFELFAGRFGGGLAQEAIAPHAHVVSLRRYNDSEDPGSGGAIGLQCTLDIRCELRWLRSRKFGVELGTRARAPFYCLRQTRRVEKEVLAVSAKRKLRRLLWFPDAGAAIGRRRWSGAQTKARGRLCCGSPRSQARL